MSQDHNHLNHATWQKGKSPDLECAECGTQAAEFWGSQILGAGILRSTGSR